MRVFPDMDALRASVCSIETGHARHAGTLTFGCAGADKVLGDVLLRGRMHELGGPAATLFAALVLARSEGSILWCAREGAGSALYPPGLAQAGLDPCRLVLMRLRRADDLLHAAHEGLRAGWHVVLEAVRPLDLSGARRLQLACEAGGGLGLAFAPERAEDVALLPSAATRWRAVSGSDALWPERLRLHLYLVRNRSGLPGQWTVEWTHASRSFSLVPSTADRQDRAARAALA
jgi:protein ImuA